MFKIAENQTKRTNTDRRVDAARLSKGWYQAVKTCRFLVVSQFEIRVSTQNGPDESAQSFGRVVRLSRSVRQPDHVLANSIAGHQAERRPGAGEERRATTKHDGTEVESILINKTQVG
jgi:hypothetical protein